MGTRCLSFSSECILFSGAEPLLQSLYTTLRGTFMYNYFEIGPSTRVFFLFQLWWPSSGEWNRYSQFLYRAIS